MNSVVFDPGQLGRVTITNNSSCTNEFLYVVWSVSPTDEGDQTLVAAEGARLAPGERRQLTVGFPERCGTKYQRDVYIGLSDDRATYTYSDMGNYFFAALGYYQYAPSCGTPPPGPNTPPPGPPNPTTPPIDVCPNLDGIQTTVPPGYTLVGGVCLPTNPPPIDVCPNLDGIQTTVPPGYTLVGGICVPIPPPPAVCTDAAATNFGGPLPCHYQPPAPSCGPFTFGGPISADVPNGVPGRLAYARSLGPAYVNVVEVHPANSGQFTGDYSQGFTFTPSQNYAVVIFHQTRVGQSDLYFVYTGLTAGVSRSVPIDHDDDDEAFYFNCPSTPHIDE